MDRDLLIRFEVPYSQKEAKGVRYTMSRVQEANCNSWLDMRVVRDGVFQTVVSVAYSEIFISTNNSTEVTIFRCLFVVDLSYSHQLST